MTVWVVWNWFMEEVLAVFSSEEKAETFISSRGDRNNLTLDSFEVDHS